MTCNISLFVSIWYNSYCGVENGSILQRKGPAYIGVIVTRSTRGPAATTDDSRHVLWPPLSANPWKGSDVRNNGAAIEQSNTTSNSGVIHLSQTNQHKSQRIYSTYRLWRRKQRYTPTEGDRMPRYKRPSVHERAYYQHRCHGTRSLTSSLGKTTKGFGCHKKWDRNRMPRLNTSKSIHNVNSAQKSNVYRSSSNTKTGPHKRKAKRGCRPQSNQKTSTRFQGDSPPDHFGRFFREN